MTGIKPNIRPYDPKVNPKDAREWVEGYNQIHELDNMLTGGTKMPVTIFDVAKHLGAKENADGSINGGEFETLNLPIIGGCCSCHATIAVYNAYPTTTGYLMCQMCVEHTGFETAAEAAQFMFGGTELISTCGHCGGTNVHKYDCPHNPYKDD